MNKESEQGKTIGTPLFQMKNCFIDRNLLYLLV